MEDSDIVVKVQGSNIERWRVTLGGHMQYPVRPSGASVKGVVEGLLRTWDVSIGSTGAVHGARDSELMFLSTPALMLSPS